MQEEYEGMVQERWSFYKYWRPLDQAKSWSNV